MIETEVAMVTGLCPVSHFILATIERAVQEPRILPEAMNHSYFCFIIYELSNRFKGCTRNKPSTAKTSARNPYCFSVLMANDDCKENAEKVKQGKWGRKLKSKSVNSGDARMQTVENHKPEVEKLNVENGSW